MYREPPPDRFNHLVLEGFAPGMKSAAHMCAFLHENNLEPDDCRREYRERWDEMWREALPRFDHVLLWEASDDVRASVEAAIAARKAAMVRHSCGGCGAPVDAGDAFCRACGTRVEEG